MRAAHRRPRDRAGAAATSLARGLALAAAAALGGCSGGASGDTVGQRDYEQACAYCHGIDGTGNRTVPSLEGDWLETPLLARVILDGLTGTVEVGGKSYAKGMVGFRGKLGDDDVARIMTFVQRRYGGREDAEVAAADVAAIRKETSERRGPWRQEELKPLVVGK